MSFIHHDVRFQAKGFYGVPSTPAMTIDLAGGKIWDAARKRSGAVANLTRLRADGSGLQQPAIILTPVPSFPSAWNQKSGWTGEGAEYVATVSGWIRGQFALQYENAEEPSAFLSPLAATIAANGGICLRFYLYEPLKSASGRNVWAATWANWRFEVAEGTARLLRKSADWTQEKESSLLDLLDIAEPSSAQQDSIDALKVEIYAQSHTVELGRGDVWETWQTVTFLPEARGFVNALVAGQKEAQSFEHSDITKTREEGVLWPACRVSVEHRGGLYAWQLGQPRFATSGTLRCGTFEPPSVFSSELPVEYATTQSTPGETDITFEVEIVGIEREIVASFSGDGASTPFLYTAEAFIAAGDRPVDNTVVFDSADPDIADIHGESPVENLEITHEGEMRQTSCTLTLRNPGGALPFTELWFNALHDRLCDLSIDDDPLLTDGLIQTVAWNTIREATPNQPATFLASGATRMTYEIASLWAILDEDLMTDSPILDDMYLGEALRTVLKNAGTPDAAMSGISPTAGKKLPKAAPGEAPAVRPGAEVSRGDCLRSLMETYGRGWRLYHSPAGVWTFAPPDTTVRATFSTAANAGRYTMFGDIDLVLDFKDFYNVIPVAGADGPDGQAITRNWTWEDSFQYSASKRYIGRIKRLATTRDQACRTKDDVQGAARSLAQYRGQPGRFLSFSTYFHLLYPGDRIIADGQAYTIRRIPSAKPFDDEMQIVAQEVIE